MFYALMMVQYTSHTLDPCITAGIQHNISKTVWKVCFDVVFISVHKDSIAGRTIFFQPQSLKSVFLNNICLFKTAFHWQHILQTCLYLSMGENTLHIVPSTVIFVLRLSTRMRLRRIYCSHRLTCIHSGLRLLFVTWEEPVSGSLKRLCPHCCHHKGQGALPETLLSLPAVSLSKN